MKNKILIFTVGLVAGLTIGVLFSVAIKELISQFKELHVILDKITLKESELSQRMDSIQVKLIPDTKKTPAPVARNNSKTVAYNSARTIAPQGNMKSQNLKNTSASSENDEATEDSDLVVITDQLVSVLNVPLKNMDTEKVKRKTEETDSALAAMSDINGSPKKFNYRVEFWKSPLNYKGYKMSTEKIVLYGLNPVTPVRLILQDDTYYLLLKEGVYKIDFTDDYKPFEEVTDKDLLKKLSNED